jgi:hypothetical protein
LLNDTIIDTIVKGVSGLSDRVALVVNVGRLIRTPWPSEDYAFSLSQAFFAWARQKANFSRLRAETAT